MIRSVIDKIFGTKSEGDLKKIQHYVDAANFFTAEFEKISDNELFAVRGQNVKELEIGLTNQMSENETSYLTTTTDNPVVYFGIYDSSELSDSLSVLWNEVKN